VRASTNTFDASRIPVRWTTLNPNVTCRIAWAPSANSLPPLVGAKYRVEQRKVFLTDVFALNRRKQTTYVVVPSLLCALRSSILRKTSSKPWYDFLSRVPCTNFWVYPAYEHVHHLDPITITPARNCGMQWCSRYTFHALTSIQNLHGKWAWKGCVGSIPADRTSVCDLAHWQTRLLSTLLFSCCGFPLQAPWS